MPARKVFRTDWRTGLNISVEADTKRFMDAVYEMPLDFVAAFESDRDALANALIASGQVRGMATAVMYATEVLGRMVWEGLLKGCDHDPANNVAPSQNLGDMQFVCGDCGWALEIVRPGKYQCPNEECPSNLDVCPECGEPMTHAGSKQVHCTNGSCPNRKMYEVETLNLTI